MKTTFPEPFKSPGESSGSSGLGSCGSGFARCTESFWAIPLGWTGGSTLVGDGLEEFDTLESGGSGLEVGVGRFGEILGFGSGGGFGFGGVLEFGFGGALGFGFGRALEFKFGGALEFGFGAGFGFELGGGLGFELGGGLGFELGGRLGLGFGEMLGFEFGGGLGFGIGGMLGFGFGTPVFPLPGFGGIDLLSPPPFPDPLPFTRSGIWMGVGCGGIFCDGGVGSGLLFTGVGVGCGPPRRRVTRGSMIGTEGGVGLGLLFPGVGVGFWLLFPGVGVGWGPPTRRVTRGLRIGMEGSEIGRSRRPRRSKGSDASMLGFKLGFAKCFARRNGTSCMLEVWQEEKVEVGNQRKCTVAQKAKNKGSERAQKTLETSVDV